MRVACGSLVFLAAAFSLTPGRATAADPPPPAGFWKLTLPGGNGQDVILMLAFSQEDGKWTGDYLMASSRLVAEPKFKSLKVSGDTVRFTLELRGRDFVDFDGVLSKDRKKLSGSVSLFGSPLVLTEMYPTKLRKIDDAYELARETLEQLDGGPQFFDAAVRVLAGAGAKKLPADEVRAILDRVNKATGNHGPRWERETTVRLAAALAGQDGLGDVAVAQAKRAERLLTDEDDALTRIRVLETVARALNGAGKPDQAANYLAQIAKLEARDYADYVKTLPFKPEPFAGRKTKSDRTVLVELFTGAECPPCVAIDLACDGLLKTYKPDEVIVLQYHMHIPRPDPLTAPDGEARAAYYGDQVGGTPTLFLAGRPMNIGGGPMQLAGRAYSQICKAIEPLLDKEPGVKLGLTVAKAEKGGFTAKATVSDLATPGEKTALRFALAEERVRFAGGNGVRYHHLVVRAMPGGTKGFPLPKATAEQTVTFDPDEVRRTLAKYLDDFAANEGPFSRPERPLDLKNLKLVAFVQNDATREILHAAMIDLEAK